MCDVPSPMVLKDIILNMVVKIESFNLGACQPKRICNSRGTSMAIKNTAKNKYVIYIGRGIRKIPELYELLVLA